MPRACPEQLIGGPAVGVQVPVEACDVVGLLDRGAFRGRPYYADALNELDENE